MWIHFKNFDKESGCLQLKKCNPEEFESFLSDFDSNLNEIPILDFEPEVQFETILASKYENNEPFTFILLRTCFLNRAGWK